MIASCLLERDADAAAGAAGFNMATQVATANRQSTIRDVRRTAQLPRTELRLEQRDRLPFILSLAILGAPRFSW
jgi:hypothetical protein